MTTSPVTLTDAIRNSFLYNMNNIHTALPGQIVDYDYTTQKASVQPTVKKAWTDGTSENLPIVNNVPVIFPASGGASLTFPVNPGDTCLLVCCERSIDQWMLSGEITQPLDPRKFDLTDAVAIIGLTPFTGTFPPRTNNTDLLLSYADSSITITSLGQIKINTASTVAIGNPLIELFGQLVIVFTALANPASGLNSTARAACTLMATNMGLIGGTLP